MLHNVSLRYIMLSGLVVVFSTEVSVMNVAPWSRRNGYGAVLFMYGGLNGRVSLCPLGGRGVSFTASSSLVWSFSTLSVRVFKQVAF